MAELFKEDPAFALELVNCILDDGDQDDLQIAFRQMDKAGLFDRAGVLYEAACDVLGTIIAHYSEALAQERGKPVPMLRPWNGSRPPSAPCGLSATSRTPQMQRQSKSVIQK